MPTMSSVTPTRPIGTTLRASDGNNYTWKGGSWVQQGTNKFAQSNIAQELNNYQTTGQRFVSGVKAAGQFAGEAIRTDPGMRLAAGTTKMAAKGAYKGAKVAGAGALALATAEDPDALIAAAVIAAPMLAIKGIGSKIKKGVMGVFGSRKAKKEATEKHDELHGGKAGSPAGGPINEKGFGKFSGKLFGYMKSIVKNSDQELSDLKKEERKAKEDAAENKKVGALKRIFSLKKKEGGGINWWKMLLFGGVAASVFFAIKKWEDIKDTLSNVYDNIKKRIKSFTNTFYDVTNKIRAFFKMSPLTRPGEESPDMDATSDDANWPKGSGDGTAAVTLPGAQEKTPAEPPEKNITASAPASESGLGYGAGDDEAASTSLGPAASQSEGEIDPDAPAGTLNATELKAIIEKSKAETDKSLSEDAGKPEKTKDKDVRGSPKSAETLAAEKAQKIRNLRTQAFDEGNLKYLKESNKYLELKTKTEKSEAKEHLSNVEFRKRRESGESWKDIEKSEMNRYAMSGENTQKMIREDIATGKATESLRIQTAAQEAQMNKVAPQAPQASSSGSSSGSGAPKAAAAPPPPKAAAQSSSSSGGGGGGTPASGTPAAAPGMQMGTTGTGEKMTHGDFKKMQYERRNSGVPHDPSSPNLSWTADSVGGKGIQKFAENLTRSDSDGIRLAGVLPPIRLENSKPIPSNERMNDRAAADAKNSNAIARNAAKGTVNGDPAFHRANDAQGNFTL